jgi:16S rRNA (uracil1498-N3)-methyltransferase
VAIGTFAEQEAQGKQKLSPRKRLATGDAAAPPGVRDILKSALAETSMARTDFSSPRLYVEPSMKEGGKIVLAPDQANYLLNVLRLREGARVLVFNGRDGEFASRIENANRKNAALTICECLRPQEFAPDIDYLFAPLKHARLDYMAQKAVEMGARRLRPVMTRRTQSHRVNLDRLRANAQEAAEQCGIIWLPEILAEEPLDRTIENWPADRLLIFCDEDAPRADPLAALAGRSASGGLALLIGPEGGFDDKEREAILRLPHIVRLSLGPRILRADTAAVAALALIQAQLGDWC